MATEASEVERAAAHLPPPETLVDLARQRLTRELRALPPSGSAAWRAALLADAPVSASLGALTHAIRASARAGRMDDAQAFFVALLRRIDGLNRRWVAGVVRSLPATERYERAQDLAQELALRLWQQVGLRDDPAWELFFQRALDYAQRHVATAYLRRQGLRAYPQVEQAERGLALVFSRLVGEAGAETLEAPSLESADLADLRAFVAQLPERERLAVVMRYWQRATEAEIAVALGGVSTRAVRYTLRRAYERLRHWYLGVREDGASDEEATDEQ